MKDLETILRYFLDYLSIEKGLAKNTIISYKYDLVKYIDFLKKNNIKSFNQTTKSLVNYYFIFLKKEGLEINSISRSLVAIKIFYRFLLAENYIKEDISSLIEFPRINKKLPHILSLREINILLEDSNFKGNLGRRDQAILELFYATGVRVSELINLKIEEINMENQNMVYLIDWSQL